MSAGDLFAVIVAGLIVIAALLSFTSPDR